MIVSLSDTPQLNVQEVTNATNNKDLSEKVCSEDAKKSTSAFLYFAAIVANLTSVSFGIAVVWISPVSSRLLLSNPEENPLGNPVTLFELSLIGSLSQIGMVIGPVLLEKIFEQFGRKRYLSIINLLIALTYTSLALSRNIILYYILIFIEGILLGSANVALAVYLSEITEDHNRGKLSCYMGLFIPIGNLYGFVLGPFLSVQVFTILSALPSIIFVILSELFLPETPTYLVLKGKREDAVNASKKLLGRDSGRAEAVVSKIEFFLSHNIKDNEANIKIIWSDKAARNGFITGCTLMILNAATGIAAIMAYLEPIFDEARTDVSASLCAIFVGFVQIVCYFTASILIEKWGRRPLLLLSALTSSIPLFMLGLYFYILILESPFVEEIKWIPVTGTMLLMVTTSIGVCSIPMAFMNEVFTNNVKSTAITYIYFISGIVFSFSVFMFPIMMENIGLSWTFWMFCMYCLLGFVFIYFRVPETKGKNILEIQDILRK